MSNKPKISVILPTYNRPNYLFRALNSIINQTYTNLEIIIIDDSTNKKVIEKNKEIIQKTKDNRIKYIKTKEQCGGSKSRNIGIKKSQGEFISFLDDDDEWLKDKLEKQINKFYNSDLKNLGLVYCNYIIIDVTREPNSKLKIKDKKRGKIFKDLLNNMCVGVTSTILVKKEVFEKIGNFDSKLKSAQEYDFLLRVSKYYPIDFVEEYLVNKYEDENRLSTNFKNKFKGINYFYKKHKKDYKKLKIKYRIYNFLRFNFLKFVYLIGMIFGNNIMKLLHKLTNLLRK